MMRKSTGREQTGGREDNPSGMVIRRMLAVALMASAATPIVAFAQATPAAQPDGQQASLEDIVVTATKTGETRAQSTPLAITVVTADHLAASGIANVRDIAQLVPNLNVSQTGTNPLIYLRGIGSSNVNNGSDPEVTTQVDGVYIARPYAELSDYLDVERVEVLRGPQGTIYGRNAVGGTFNIVSRKPGDEFRGEASLASGTFGLLDAKGYVSGPIVPGILQASIAGNFLSHDGYVHNVVSGAHDLGDAHRGGLRGQLRFTPDPKIEIILRGDWSHIDEHFDNYDHLLAPLATAPLATSLIGDYTQVAANDPQQTSNTLWGASGEVNVRLGNAVALKSITAYRHSRFDLAFDSDGTEISSSIGQQNDSSHSFSQELNLSVNTSHLQGVVGAYYFNEEENSLVLVQSPPSAVTPAAKALQAIATPVTQVRSYAGFAQATYRPITAIGITAGIRYTSDHKALDTFINRTSLNPATPGAQLAGFPVSEQTAQTFHAWTPKFGIDWQVTPHALVYASATRGFKSGGTNYSSTNPATLNYRPESLWAYEGGLKSSWFEQRLRINITGFKYDYTDLQVQGLLAPGVVAIGNAAGATVKGVEFETAAKPFRNLELTANYSILDARYDNFTGAAVSPGLVAYVASSPRFNATARTYDASGNHMIQAPHSTFSASGQYNFDVGRISAYFRAEYYWQDKTYFDPTNVPIVEEPSHGVINLGAGILTADKHWALKVLARNITDKNYLIGRSGVTSVPSGLAGAPRTVMVQISRKW